ncbi:hypothetical protein HNR62_002225 [Oceanisphaera litoralis]|uniref:hypothetical protein n=1 Tax=Oceanisphaera litoralis TaxID=225144 RepID=UPI00195A9026|nr:hypothetical protein [Oceanisphaera litoralis]MBM7456339.1 hypothetical protein [Oceanisphaera litoralis]
MDCRQDERPAFSAFRRVFPDHIDLVLLLGPLALGLVDVLKMLVGKAALMKSARASVSMNRHSKVGDRHRRTEPVLAW